MEVSKKTTTTKKRESKLLSELCVDHHYLFQKLQRDVDKFTTQFEYNKKTRKLMLTPAVCIKLIVPVDSSLGAKVVDMYKGDKNSKIKKRSRW